MPSQPTFVPNTDADEPVAGPTTSTAPVSSSITATTATVLSGPQLTPTQSDIQLEGACPYCADAAQPPLEQFYETKLFRVIVSRKPLTKGHVIIIPKNHDPHFYRFDLDQLEEFGYLIKKVSFIAMRQTNAPGFSLVMSDGAPEVANNDHLEIHIVPRQIQDATFQHIGEILAAQVHEMDDAAIASHVADLKNLMQLPQDTTAA